jgi:hypothetical protein
MSAGSPKRTSSHTARTVLRVEVGADGHSYVGAVKLVFRIGDVLDDDTLEALGLSPGYRVIRCGSCLGRFVAGALVKRCSPECRENNSRERSVSTAAKQKEQREVEAQSRPWCERPGCGKQLEGVRRNNARR